MSLIIPSKKESSSFRSSLDSVEVAAISTIEHLRGFRVTTSADVGRVLGRCIEIMLAGRSTRPSQSLNKAIAGSVDSMGDCPKCFSPSLAFHSEKPERRSTETGVTRICLACTMPECGFVED